MGGLTCASFPEQWHTVLPEALPFVRAYGVHPWAAGQVREADLAALEAHLRQEPMALVGEIGLDGMRPVADGGVQQRRLLQRQLTLAAALVRPVVLHGAKRWGVLFDELEPWAERLPAMMVHGAAFAPELLQRPLFRTGRIWFSFGSDLLRQGCVKAAALAAAVPLERVLIETDLPDRLPPGSVAWISESTGERVNHPATLHRVGAALAHVRGLPVEVIAEQTFLNARAFCAARGE